jgi:hypothetical protein
MDLKLGENFSYSVGNTTRLHGPTCSTKNVPVYRARPMVRLTCCLPLLLVIFILTPAYAVSDQYSELQGEIAGIRKLKHRNELLLGQCYVSGYYIVHVSLL